MGTSVIWSLLGAIILQIITQQSLLVAVWVTHSHSLASAIIIKIILTTFPVVNMQAIHASFYPSSHYHFHKNFPLAKSFDSRIIIVIVIALGNLVLRSHRNEYSVLTLHAQRLKKAA